MNPKLAAISDQAIEDLHHFIEEAADKILEAWSQAEEEARANETKPVLRLGFTIALDLDANKMETTLAFSVRHKLSRECEIPDGEQIEMEMSSEGIKR